VVFSVVMVVLPERGLPDRYDPASESPYLAYLHEHLGQSRVVGVNGVLFPNYASALGVNDIRYILALAPENLHAYRSTLLHQEPLYGESSTSLWFTGNPQMDVRISDNSVRTQRDIGTDIISNLRYFSAMGVQYVLGPSGYDLDVDQSDGRMTDTKALKLVYDKEIRIWENLDVFPRIWVTSNLQKADTLGQALDTIKAKDFDLLSQAVIEGGPEIPGGPSAPVKWSAKITGYGHNTVLIEAELDKPGLLILSDTYYPGWEATVDGIQASIYRVDGLFRGVYVNAGRHQIVFNYRPVSFLAGLGIAVLALMLLFALSGKRFRVGHKPHH
jgi:hypothetical protein